MSKQSDNIKNTKAAQDELNMSFRDYQQVLKGINEGLGVKRNNNKDASKEYNTLIGIARKMAAVEEGILDISDKQLQAEKAKAEGAIAHLNTLATELKDKKKLSAEEAELVAAQEHRFDISQSIVKKIQEEQNIRAKVNEKLGVSGKLLQGIKESGGQIAAAFNLDKVADDMKNFADEAVRSGEEISKLDVLFVGIQSAVTNLADSLTDPAVVIGAIISGIGRVQDAQKEFRQLAGQNVQEFDNLNTSLTTTAEYIGAAVTLSEQLNRNAAVVFTPETILEVAELTENMGLSAEAASRFALLAKVGNKDTKEISKNVEKRFKTFVKEEKTALNFGSVMEKVGNMSDAMTVSLGMSEKNITEAVLAAEKLGLEMDTIDGIASSLLDFESSISAELEAELLTGKSLNLETARRAALNNDIKVLAEEIGKNEEILGAFKSGNRIQQEAIAKAMGMTREDVAKIVLQKQLDKGLSIEAAAKAADISVEEAKRLTTQEQISKFMAKISEYAAQLLSYIMPIVENETAMYILMGAMALMFMPKLLQGFGSMASDVKSMVGGFGDMGKAMMGGGKEGGFMGGLKKSLGMGDKIDKETPKKKPDPKKGNATKLFLKGLADGLKYFGKNFGQVVKGALALGIVIAVLGGGFALAMVMLKDVDPVKMIAFAGSLAILGITLAIMGNIGANIILGAAAMLVLALALIPAAFAFSLLEGVDIGKMFAFSLALPLLALAAAGLGFLAPFIIWGSMALMALGLAMIPAAYAFSLLKDVDLTAFTEAMTGLVGGPIIAGMYKLGGALGAVGFAIRKFAFSMAIMSVFGGISGMFGGGPLGSIKELALLADPLASAADSIMRMAVALRGVGSAISSIDTSTLKTLERFAAKSAIASAAQGITAAITAPIQAIGSMFGGGKENKEHAELMAKLDKLIAATEAGKIIEMDGQKVGKSVAMNSSRIG